jgi:hypothetical protein
MPSVKRLPAETGAFEALQAELNNTLTIAHIGNRNSSGFGQKPNHLGGVPLWAFEICAVLLLLVVVTVYAGNCLTKRFNTRAQVIGGVKN